MKPSNDNAAQDNQTDSPAQPPFNNGHENASVTEHTSEINFDTKDGFGNAQWDVREKKRSVESVPVEEKLPPAF